MQQDDLQQLCSAIRDRQADRVQILLQRGVDINAVSNQHGNLPLELACQHDNVEIVHLLLKAGASCTGVHGTQSLSSACQFGHVAVIDALVDHGVSVNAFDRQGHTPLYCAVTGRQADAVLRICERDADVNLMTANGRIPLHAAVENADLTVVEILILCGANPDAVEGTGNCPLHVAVKTTCVEVVTFLLQSGASVDSRDVDNLTPLSLCAKYGTPGIATVLIEWGADVNALDPKKGTPIHCAVSEERTDMVCKLIEYGANVNVPREHGVTPLMTAASRTNEEVVKMLLRAGADMESQISISELRCTALYGAISNGQTDMACLLIKAGAIVNASESGRKSPLHAAVEKCNLRVVNALLDAGADVDAVSTYICNETPLSNAVRSGCVNIVRSLIARGADLNASISGGFTPLMEAVTLNNHEITSLLVSSGADVNKTEDHGLTAAILAINFGFKELAYTILKGARWEAIDQHHKVLRLLEFACDNENVEVIHALLDGGFDVNAVKSKGSTVLMNAAERGQVKVLEALIERGANVDASNNRGSTALHLAAQRGHIGTVLGLLNAGADCKCKDQRGMTPLLVAENAEVVRLLLAHLGSKSYQNNASFSPLFSAAHDGNVEEVERLLSSSGFRVDEKAGDGSTPMMWASRMAHVTVVAELLEVGAEVNARDDRDQTALWYAAANGHHEVVRELMNRGAVISGDWKFDTPLSIALERGHESVVRELRGPYASKLSCLRSDDIDSLFFAAKTGNTEIVKTLIANGLDINLHNDTHDGTALHAACENGQLGVALTLIASGADLHLVDSRGKTPLWFAAARGSVEIVKELTARGASVNASSDEKSTPLIVAAQNGHSEIIVKLLAREATRANCEIALQKACAEGHVDVVAFLLSTNKLDLSFFASGRRPLLFAAENGKANIVELLLEHKAEVNVNDEKYDGTSPLFVASLNGHEATVRILLQHGANCNSTNTNETTPLAAAASSGHVSIVQMLLKFGAAIDKPDYVGRTPLWLAAASGLDKVVSVLIEHGADVNASDNSGSTPIIVAERNRHHKTVEQLVRRGGRMHPGLGASSQACKNSLRTAALHQISVDLLHFACIKGQPHVVDLHIANGHDVNVRDSSNKTPLSVAVELERVEIVERLVKAGADVNALVGTDGLTPILNIAAATGNKYIVDILIRNGAKCNVRKSGGIIDSGKTPLHAACTGGHVDIVRSLISNGACIDEKCSAGKTPLVCSIIHGFTGIVDILLSNGASAKFQSILHLAIRHDRIDLVHKLLDAGAHIESVNEHGLTPLWEAVVSNKTELAIALIERGADVNVKLCRDEKIWTILIGAIGSDTRLVQSLIRSGADINAKSNNNNTPLMEACSCGNYGIVLSLLEAGACVNDRNLDGYSPLICAFGNPPIMELMLSHGAQVNRYLSDPNSKSPLHYAIIEASTEALRVLLQHGLDVNELSSSGMQPLYIACLKQRIDVVELLLDHGAEINALSAGRSTAFDAAVYQQNLDLMQLLLKRGSDVIQGFDKNIYTAVSLGNEDVVRLLVQCNTVEPSVGREAFALAVVRGGRSGILRLLLDFCPIEFKANDMNDFLTIAVNNDDQSTLDLLLNLFSASTIHITDRDNKCCNVIFTAAKRGQSKIVRLLIERGVDVDVRDVEGKTPTIIAASCGHLDTVRLLVENGSDVFAVDDDGTSALQHAAFNGHRDVVSLLLHYQRYSRRDFHRTFEISGPQLNVISLRNADHEEHFAKAVDIDAENPSGSTPLHLNVRRGYTESAQLLIFSGAKTDAANFFGDTPLHEAARYGIEITKLLLPYVRQVNVQNNRGSSPLHEAVQSRLFDVALYLMQNGADPGITDNWMNTPFQYASHEDLLDLLPVLGGLFWSKLSCWAKPNVIGISVLKRFKHLSRWLHGTSNSKAIIYSRQKKQHSSDVDELGNTELHRAVGIYGASKLYPVFLAADKAIDTLLSLPGSHVNVRNLFGQTPLHVARSITAVEACLKYGGKAALKEVDKRGRNYWHQLASRDDADKILRLIEMNIRDSVDVGLDATDALGRTPLHYAISRTNGETFAAWLIDKAEHCLELSDRYGRTPLHNWYSGSDDCYDGSQKKEPFLIQLRKVIECGVKNTPSRFNDAMKEVHAVASQQRHFVESRTLVLDQFESILSHIALGRQEELVLTPTENVEAFIWNIWTSHVYTYVNNDVSQSDRFQSSQKAQAIADKLPDASIAVFQAVTDVVTNTFQSLVKRISAIDDRFKGQLVPAGSAHERTKIDFCDEFDFVIALTNFSQQCVVVESPYSPPGFVHLKRNSQHNNSSFDEFFNENGILNTRLVKFTFEKLVKLVFSEASFQQENDHLELIDNVRSENFFNTFFPDRLATNVRMKFMKPICGQKLFHDISIDIVPAVNIENYWPTSANPNPELLFQHLVEPVPKRCCYLVFDQPQKKHPWTRWTSPHARVDFSVFESNVIRSCPPTVLASCIIVKQIVRNFSDFRFIKSYVIKAALMHCLVDVSSKVDLPTDEDVTDESIDKIVSLVQRIVRRLLCFVMQDFVPSLFMPKFALPVCSFEPYLKFSHVKLHLSGLSYEQLVNSNLVTGKDRNRFVDAQFANVIRAFVVSHLMMWSVLPNTARRQLYLPPINPLREVDYWSSLQFEE